MDARQLEHHLGKAAAHLLFTAVFDCLRHMRGFVSLSFGICS